MFHIGYYPKLSNPRVPFYGKREAAPLAEFDWTLMPPQGSKRKNGDGKVVKPDYTLTKRKKRYETEGL